MEKFTYIDPRICLLECIFRNYTVFDINLYQARTIDTFFSNKENYILIQSYLTESKKKSIHLKAIQYGIYNFGSFIIASQVLKRGYPLFVFKRKHLRKVLKKYIKYTHQIIVHDRLKSTPEYEIYIRLNKRSTVFNSNYADVVILYA